MADERWARLPVQVLLLVHSFQAASLRSAGSLVAGHARRGIRPGSPGSEQRVLAGGAGASLWQRFGTHRRVVMIADGQASYREPSEVDGVVVEVLPRALFRIELENGQTVLAHLSGRMRLNVPRLLPRDRVRVRLSSFDRSRGRIVQRYR